MKTGRRHTVNRHTVLVLILLASLFGLSNCFDSSTEEAPPSLNEPPPASPPQPVAQNDTLSIPNNTPGTVSVLDNDSSENGDISIDSFDATGANNGSIIDNGDGTFTYTPPDGFEGEDTFTYTIIDAIGERDTATVVVTVSNQVIPNGKSYYAQNCQVCHAAGTDDTSTAFLATDLALSTNVLRRDLTAYGGDFQLMGAFYDIPQQKVDELKAYLASL